jgi:hypothetical protein
VETKHSFKSFDTDDIPQELIETLLDVVYDVQKHGGFIIAATVVSEDLRSNVLVKGIHPELVKQMIDQISKQLDRYCETGNTIQ